MKLHLTPPSYEKLANYIEGKLRPQASECTTWFKNVIERVAEENWVWQLGKI